MLKAIITIAIAFALYWLGKSVFTEYKTKEENAREAEAREEAGLGSDGLAGMHRSLEPSLNAAASRGPEALKDWLDRYGPRVRDPKLADIQLDYAVMLARQDPAQASRLYHAVKRRVPENSPIYPRVKRLEATFGN